MYYSRHSLLIFIQNLFKYIHIYIYMCGFYIIFIIYIYIYICFVLNIMWKYVLKLTCLVLPSDVIFHSFNIVSWSLLVVPIPLVMILSHPQCSIFILSFFFLSFNTFHRKNKKKGKYGSVMEDLRTN